MKYTITDLQSDFPTEDACLQWLVEYLYPNGITCKKCQKVTKHYKDADRKSYSCGNCGHHIHPTAGTIFHKSSTPLTLWFYAIHQMTSTRCGYPAAQLQRDIGVTYKCAWRMLHQIRKMMQPKEEQLSGEIEVDETFIHGNVYKRSSAQKRYGHTGSRMGQVVFGIKQRGGEARLYHIKAAGARVILPKIEENVRWGSTIYSDGWLIYKSLGRRGYKHHTTNHSLFQWADGTNSVQSIESVWSRFKMGIKGVYRHVSDRHLQKYCDEFGFRESNRNAISMFWVLMGRVSQPSLRL